MSPSPARYCPRCGAPVAGEGLPLHPEADTADARYDLRELAAEAAREPAAGDGERPRVRQGDIGRLVAKHRGKPQ